MTVSDYLNLSVLDLLDSVPQCTNAVLYSSFDRAPLDVKALVDSLISSGFVRYTGSVYKLTSSGRARRLVLTEMLQQESHQQAEDEAAKRLAQKRKNEGCLLHGAFDLFLILLASFLSEYTGFFHSLFAFVASLFQ